MNLTDPVIKQPRHISDRKTAKDWLDALATGTCDQRTFLRGLGELLVRAPDSGWDMLALLDQYYRRGKVSADTFTSLKGHLQTVLMGKAGGELIPQIATARDPHVPTVRDPHVPTVRDPQIPTVRDEFVKTSAGPASVVPLPASERAPADGDVLRGRYRLLKLVGRGAMGSVFEALDLSRVNESEEERRVAVKVFHPAVMQRPRLLAELRLEFQRLQALSHPNIVRVHEFDRDGDVAFFTMEFLRGMTLRRLLAADDPRTLDRHYALAIVRDVGAAIAHARSRGLVHGNLNPGNIFVTDEGDVRVLDFGATPELQRTPWIEDPDDIRPAAVEPPTFVSCEVLEGAQPEASDDVYSLACVTYLLLAGHHPFQDISSLKARSLRLSPRRPRGLTRRQWVALRAGLALDRARRPTDVAAWIAEVDVSGAVPRLPVLPSLLASRPRPLGGVSWPVVGAAAALLGVGAWWIAGHGVALDGRGAGRPAAEESDTSGNGAPPDATPATLPAAPTSTTERTPARVLGTPDAAPQPAAPTAPQPRAAATRPATVAAARPVTPAASPDAPMSPGARARIELAADNVEVSPGDSTAKIMVRRTRSLRGDASFSWWTESGTAKPGQDFVAVKSHVETIPSGQASLELLVPIVMDPARRQERNFYIVIDEPSDNAALGTRTLTMVTIPSSQPD